ncbi:MAG: hypothetical protein LH660_00855 [Phormidesmis sp. CAN_BIN36]|nr:hypothetical protein [Phormidesmis sp. CAN_BIN36]
MHTDTLTLQAFLLALAQIDALPADLHRQIHNLGTAIASDELDVADRIRHLVRQHDRLHQLYQDAYDRLQRQYPNQERAQALFTTSRTPLMTWKEIAVPVLTADDFRSAARHLLKRMSRQRSSASGAERVFLVSLQQAVSELDAHSIAVLKALEKRPLTVKGLGYITGHSQAQARQLMQELCQAGYIDRTTSNILHKVFPGLGRNLQQTCENFDLDTYFTLTARGHFLLHPVITFGRRVGGIL